MTKFILTSTQFKGEVVFIYNAKLQLVYMDVRAQLDPDQHAYIMENMPGNISDLKKFRTKSSTIRDMPLDLSFENFWDIYAYKEGTKKRAVSTWNRLTKEERIKAIDYIRVYDGKRAQTPGIDKQLPETYLSSERWNTE